MITRIFAAIWALWGITVFMTVVILLTPVYAITLGIGDKKIASSLIAINQKIASPFILLMCGIRIEILGRENINMHECYVFVSNHITWIDILCNAFATPMPIRFLAKSELKAFPVFGFMVKMLGIMVNRKDKESREKSFNYMVQELQNGNSVFIYPEGTRNRTNQLLKDFKDGAFRAAIAAQKPLSWQVIIGARKLNKNDTAFLLPGKVRVCIGKPISTIGMKEEDVMQLHTTVKEEMLKELIKQGETV